MCRISVRFRLFLSTVAQRTAFLMPVTDIPENGTRKLVPTFGTNFLVAKLLPSEMNMADENWLK